MGKKKTSELIDLIFTFVILSSFLGIKETFKIIMQILTEFNSILMSHFDTTILNVMFKYFITFPLVGIVLSTIGSPRGKEGHRIGKILYFTIGYVIGIILDLISKLIF